MGCRQHYGVQGVLWGAGRAVGHGLQVVLWGAEGAMGHGMQAELWGAGGAMGHGVQVVLWGAGGAVGCTPLRRATGCAKGCDVDGGLREVSRALGCTYRAVGCMQRSGKGCTHPHHGVPAWPRPQEPPQPHI